MPPLKQHKCCCLPVLNYGNWCAQKIHGKDVGKHTHSALRLENHSGFSHLSGLIAMHQAPSHVSVLPLRGKRVPRESTLAMPPPWQITALNTVLLPVRKRPASNSCPLALDMLSSPLTETERECVSTMPRLEGRLISSNFLLWTTSVGHIWIGSTVEL